MTCIVPSNQPIYEALIKKATSYITDNPNKAKAYNKASDNIRSSKIDIYKIAKHCNNLWNWLDDFEDDFPNIGAKISTFIFEYIEDNPMPTISTPVPTSKANQNIVKAITSNPVDENALTNEITNIMAGAKTREEALALLNPVLRPSIQQAFIECVTKNSVQAAPSISDTIMSFIPSNPPENLNTSEGLVDKKINQLKGEPILGSIIDGGVRHSSRLEGKPKVQYHQDDDSNAVDDLEDDDEAYIDEDDIDEEDYDDNRKAILAIKEVCDKKGWEYSDDLITEYNQWRATATEDYKIKKYIHLEGYRILSEPDIAKRWATDFSDSLRKQKQRKEIDKAIFKYCNKHNIQYEDDMIKKYIAWYNTPSIQEWVKTSYIRPSYTTPINEWFATLKKIIVW
jgi:hypothetical protein